LAYFYAGNFYILDKGASTIYRYPGTDEGFGSKRDWFNEGVTFDVSGAKEWVIDGKLWVVTNDGKVLNFSLGYPQNFSLSKVTPALSKIDAIFTEEELESLYLLDTENERVLVTDKSGEYKAQYIAPDIRKAKGLAASEEEKKLILLTNDKLLSIDLEHL
jgi:hypothetical protein